MSKRPCARCTRPTQRADGLCRYCANLELSDPMGLSGGQWKPNRHGVQVWVELPDGETEPSLTPEDIANMVACPVCAAKVCQSCKTVSGHPTTHAERLIPRRCPCGSLVEPRKQYCEPCRVRQRRATYRRREIAMPTALRRAVKEAA